MAVFSGTKIVNDNLVLNIDLANAKLTASGSKKDLKNKLSISEINGITVSYNNLGEWVFDGVDDYVTLGNPATLNLTEEETTIAWIYPTVVSGSYRARIGNRHGGFLTLMGSQFGYEGMNNSGVWDNNHYSSGSTLKQNIWQQVAFTFKASDRIDLFYNGAYNTGKVVSGSQTGAGIEFQIGTENAGGWGTPPYFTGKIGTILVYSRKLTSAEIQQNFEATRGRYGV
jgi:hypothetical protein